MTRTTIALGGTGAIGAEVARHLAGRLREHYELTAVTARRADRAQDLLAGLGLNAPVVAPHELAEHADIVVECAPAPVFRQIAEPAVERGRLLVPLSAAALLDSWDLVRRAELTGACVHVPTGAFLGLDAVQAAALGGVRSVRLITRKPVAGLRTAPWFTHHDVDPDSLTEAVRLFHGSPREAARDFPANVNVAVALSLAGIGPDRTEMELWADPAARTNTHRVLVDSDAAQLDFSISGTPSGNPATGLLTPLSVVALLQKLAASLRIGT